LATDQQAEIESNDNGLVAAGDDHDMQPRDPPSYSEDEDDTNELSGSGHDVSEAEAYAELVNPFQLHDLCNAELFDAITPSK
jgi:hypothetical protein